MSKHKQAEREKVIQYQTHWKQFYREFVKAWALIPVFGAGFFKLRKLNKRLEKMVYRIYNDRIEIGKAEDAIILPIPDLRKVKKEQTPEQHKYGIADVLLTYQSETYRLKGLEHADALEDVLYIAIKTEQKRKELEEKAKGDHHIDPGGLDQMNYLTGLWQQGMISDEDFEKEQKKFNSVKKEDS